jgi:hypothetical protein
MASDRPSEWQRSIEGDWHGVPSVFDADGTHVGHIEVQRASVFADGRTTYTMDTRLDVRGPLRARFEARDFAFGVIDSDRDRIYLGPDFVGAGHPCGLVVDAHYYSPGWAVDLRTLVHILPDEAGGPLQVYSSLLHDGPTLVAVFNGCYRMARGHGDDPEVTARIDGFLARERVAGPRSHVLPFKERGSWRGELAVHDGAQAPLGTALVRVDYGPLDLRRAEVAVSVEGPWSRSFRYVRARHGNRHTYEGPDVWGNAIGYGRALYTSQHLHGEALKIRGREFLIDDGYTLSAVWQVLGSDRLRYTLYGRLDWHPADRVLAPVHAG